MLNFVWDQIGHLLKGAKSAQTFRIAYENWDKPIIRPLEQMTELAFVEVIRSYQAARGKGDEATDSSSFFKKKGLDKQFAEFWRRRAAVSRGRFSAAMNTFASGLEEAEY